LPHSFWPRGRPLGICVEYASSHANSHLLDLPRLAEWWLSNRNNDVIVGNRRPAAVSSAAGCLQCEGDLAVGEAVPDLLATWIAKEELR